MSDNKKAWRKKYPKKAWARNLYDNARARARNKEVECTISPEFLLRMLDDQNNCCAIESCNVLLEKGGEAAASLDEINPGYGYVADNVALLCKNCNRRKADETIEQRKEILHMQQAAKIELLMNTDKRSL